MKPFAWIEARTPEQAVAELRERREGTGEPVLKAGGVDLLDRLKEGLEAPGRLVSIRRARGHGLDELREEAGALRLGALLTLARLADDPLVRRHAPALAEAAANAATPQIRQAATLGGNLLQRPRCWYLRSREHVCRKRGGTRCFAQDGENDLHAVFANEVCAAVHPSSLATVLMAHGASFWALGPAGLRQAPIEELFLAPGGPVPGAAEAPGADLLRDHRLGPAEVLCGVAVPLQPGARGLYLKAKHKQSFDWPLCEVAVVLRRSADGAVAEARVVLGAVAPVPWRVRGAEAALRGLRRPDEAAMGRAVSAALAGARPLARNGYKLHLVRGLLGQALRQALAAGGDDAP